MSTTRPDSPGWVATGATLEPDGSKKSAGFAAGDVPPAKAFNWFWAAVSTWFTWVTERFADGGSSADLAIKAPDGESGDVSLTAGSAPAGTDQDGGDAVLSGGASTGSAGTKSVLMAATAGVSGTGSNTPEAYLEADGGAGTPTVGQITVLKPLVAEGTVHFEGVVTADLTIAATRSVSGRAAVNNTHGIEGSRAAGVTGASAGRFLDEDDASSVRLIGSTAGVQVAVATSGIHGVSAVPGANAVGVKADVADDSTVPLQLEPRAYSAGPTLTLADGMMWIDTNASAGQELKIRIGGTTRYINYT